MIGQPVQRKLVKGTSQFYMRYNPKTVLPPVASRYILSETHPIRPKIQHLYANRDPSTLWWRVNPQPLQSFKRVVRSWATRRVRLAFRQALAAQGFDVEGRRLVSETPGSAAMRSNDGLQGSLEIAVLPQSVKVGYDSVRKEMDYLLRTLLRHLRDGKKQTNTTRRREQDHKEMPTNTS
ncbi:hypothetical protein Asppvi_009140 [Aspergillus pseudoviridinutans]|uniref:Uncharacterized protein n=1 Tax=Aspergillus pseudoviridinutans TaxID=1517512 RepID=A0A9P3EY53_9EURO|nr:uncharacterized protein Asppvi_009140 [Aspergillus pseudoviridinutans]GIJ90187.1 hypothetical protein Asppvi_009140 [Aspergillus pseudoviridinutans]